MEDEASGYLWSEWLRFAKDAFQGNNIGAECSYWFGVSTVLDRMGQIATSAEGLNDQDALKLLEEGLKEIAEEIEDFKTRCIQSVVEQFEAMRDQSKPMGSC